ncbi:hypothetical protein AB6A40_005923 [Gnathostoma spinigerum]|uniref:Uncharacterized protein n=1 Tax=Gnathostoma spinigerum TaxID=75299 RepID=A0ABD6EGW2_9BILA
MPTSDSWTLDSKNGSSLQHHLVDMSSSEYFYVTPPEKVEMIDVYGSNNKSKRIPAGDLGHKMRSFAEDPLGAYVDIVAGSGNVQVGRIGHPRSSGVYLDMVPAYSQWITGPTAFKARYEGDQLLVFGDNITATSYTLSSTQKIPAPALWVKINGLLDNSVYAILIGLIDSERVILTSPGRYVAFVVGAKDHHAYAYTPAVNIPATVTRTTTEPTTSKAVTTTTKSTTTTKTATTKVTTGRTIVAEKLTTTTAGGTSCTPVITLALFLIIEAIIR